MKSEKQNIKKKQKSVLNLFLKPFSIFWEFTPVLLGVILLIGLFLTFVSKEIISSVFTGNILYDTLIGTISGSIFAGNPINSYIIGGELLKRGVSLFAVIAFIVAWVTVGLIQYSAEAATLGKQFAFLRNLLSFILAILVSISTVTTLIVIL